MLQFSNTQSGFGWPHRPNRKSAKTGKQKMSIASQLLAKTTTKHEFITLARVSSVSVHDYKYTRNKEFTFQDGSKAKACFVSSLCWEVGGSAKIYPDALKIA